MALKVGAEDLVKSLQKAGVPFGNSIQMGTATPGLGSTIQTDLYANDPALNSLRSTYRSQLDQVAAADQNLSKVYSDPNSPLFTNNVYAREKIISGAHSVNSNAARAISSAGKGRQSELDQQANEAVSYYKDLTSLQAKEEARAAKAARAANKKTALDSYQKSEELRKQKAALAGLANPDAIDAFERAPTDFQNQWIREYQNAKNTGDAGSPEEQQYTADDIKEAWVSLDKKTAKPVDQNAADAKLQKLKDSLSKL